MKKKGDNILSMDLSSIKKSGNYTGKESLLSTNLSNGEKNDMNKRIDRFPYEIEKSYERDSKEVKRNEEYSDIELLSEELDKKITFIANIIAIICIIIGSIFIGGSILSVILHFI